MSRALVQLALAEAAAEAAEAQEEPLPDEPKTTDGTGGGQPEAMND